ncbi:MAG: hypothetical protein LBL23_02800 [Coriobacteriales bacterium]|jgi:hypothetical protein|nr:hypothetical protein [Coriobacteriales bacterium]
MATFTPPAPGSPGSLALQPGQAQPEQLGEKPSVFKSIKRALGRLSTRERVLIWAFVIVGAALALVFLLVLPAHDGLLGAEDEQRTLEGEQASTQQTIATIANNQQLLASAESRHVEALLKYQAPQLPEDIDRMFTTLVEDCGFTAQAISLNPATVETVGRYDAGGLSWELPTDEASASAEGATTDAGSAEPAAGSPDATAGGETGVPSDAGVAPADASGADGTGAGDASAAGTSAAVLGSGGEGTESAASAGTAAPAAEAQALVYTVQLSMVGNDANYFALIDRILPLSWLKITSLTYTPPVLGTAAEEAAEEAVKKPYTVSLKMYVSIGAELKQP